MNLIKLGIDLLWIFAVAVCLTVGLSVLYWFTIDAPWSEPFLDTTTITLMWCSAVLGLLAGKYR